MNKIRISPQVLEDGVAILSRLSAAGWDCEDYGALFDEGVDFDVLIQAERVGTTNDLLVMYCPDDGRLQLDCLGRSGEDVLSLQLYPKEGGIAEMIDAIVEEQERLGGVAWPDAVKALIPRCKRVVAETDEGPMELK